jgi:hypothetical protein
MDIRGELEDAIFNQISRSHVVIPGPACTRVIANGSKRKSRVTPSCGTSPVASAIKQRKILARDPPMQNQKLHGPVAAV